ncbi:MAG: C40 family peptidase [Betaproteobacteria bacterium]|nr:C40 family peptidase [Betaproteobacteria bacterium]
MQNKALRFIALLLAAASLSFAGNLYASEEGVAPEEAAVQQDPQQTPPPAAEERPSLLERYTNNAHDLLLKGLQMVGVKYRRGGTDPDAGLDCSGFVQLVFRDALNVILPRTSREMSQIGEIVARDQELRPGDLVFFNTMRRAFSHVGIYLGEGRFLHSPRAGSEVRVEDMQKSYWLQRYNGARRLVRSS